MQEKIALGHHDSGTASNSWHLLAGLNGRGCVCDDGNPERDYRGMGQRLPGEK